MVERPTIKLSLGWKTFVKNGAANVMRGCSAAVVALVLTPFLTRNMTPEAYGTWVLILQLSAYTAYFDFGIQTAIGRFVAFYTEKEEARLRSELVSTSTALLSVAMVIGLLATVALAWLWPYIFHQVHGAIHQARVALLLVGASLALGLPFGVFNGIFIGLQKNEIPALVSSTNRVASAAVLIFLVLNHNTLVAMALAVLIVNLLSYVSQYLLYRRISPDISISPYHLSSGSRKELIDYCFSLSIWSFATLLVTGLDTAIVGLVDFKAVAYYAVPATLVTFILGLQNAVFGALIPMSAVLEARSNAVELGRLLVSTSRYGLLLLLLSGVPLILWAHPLLSLWVGPEYANHSALILKVLVLANIVRLSAVPYAMLLIGTGQQRLVTISPIAEGVSNLLVSVVVGYLIGAVGVAIGTLVGSTVGILCNLVYNMPRSISIAVDRLTYLRDGMLRPAVCVLPLVGFAWTKSIPLLVASGLAVLATFWRFGLLSEERALILRRLNVGTPSRATS